MSSSILEPRRYLIAIGSPSCQMMQLPYLKHVVRDIEQVTKLFEQQGYERVLSDQIIIGTTSRTIKDSLVGWFSGQQCSSNDYVIIHYAGHGDDQLGNLGEHYLLTVESNPSQLQTTAITAEELAKCFFQGDGSENPQNILLILDTCYANAGGKQISQLVSKLQMVASEGSGFWVICSSDANTEAGDGAFVEALCAVMNPERPEWQKDGEFISIETLVSRINKYFEDDGKAQRAIADGRAIQQETKFFRNPLFRSRSDTNISSPINSEQENRSFKLVDCLWSLNYRPQTRVFEDYTPRSQRVAAFIVQAKDRRIQNWLVKRLFNKLPNVTNARVFTLTIPAHPLWKNRDFDELWRELANYFECEANQTSVISRLVKIYQEKPLILAMYDLPNSSRAQQLQQDILTKLWQPLVRAIEDLAHQPKRSRLILFLAERTTTKPEELVKGSSIPIRLSPLSKISKDDLADWLESLSVSNVLHQIHNEDYIKLLIEEEIEDWDLDPVETVEQICYIFNLENGIAEIESDWRLTG